MNKSQIDYILAVAKLRNFGKAAQSCYVTQSTLSAMVAKVEGQIGITIFDRKTKPIGITPAGEVLIAQLKNIQREYAHLDVKVEELKGIHAGEVSIAGIPTVAPYLFPRILNDISVKYPAVSFTFQELTTHRIIDAILQGELDIGIVSTPLEEKGLMEYSLFEEPFVLYDKRKPNSGEEGNKVKIMELDFSKLWLLEEGHCFRNQVEKICNLRQQKAVKSNITYLSGSIASLKRIVSINKGLTLLPYLCSIDLPIHEQQAIQYFISPVPARKIGIVVHKNFVKKKILKGLQLMIKDKISPLLELQTNELNIIKPF